MSTYSTNLGLTLIGTGEQAGTWGSTTNTNLGTLLEQAISGYSTTAMVTDANTTITIPNGASGEARNMYIEIPSSLTLTAIRTLTVPTNKKLYFVYNNNNSSYGVIVKAGSSTFSGTGSITTTNMTIASVTGTISVGMIIAGTGVTAGTTIVSQTSGTTGGAGVYVVSVSQTVASTSITGQTGIYVPAGAKVAMVSNGTEIVAAENYLPSLTLGTPLAIAQGGTGQTTALIPAQSGNASKYLRSNGVNTSWDQISLDSSAFTGTGTISGTNLTISAAYGGALVPGSVIYGTGITSGTTIVSQTSSAYVNSASGGNGVYVIDTSHSLATPFTINSYADSSGILPPTSGGTGLSNGTNTLSLLSGNLGTQGVFQGQGYIIGATLYVTSVTGTNLLYANVALTGVGMLSGTTIYSQVSGTPVGGVGTYNVYVNGGVISQTWGSVGTPLDFVGAYQSAFTFTAPSTVTLPTTGTLSTLAGTETLTNKTIIFPTNATVAAAGTTQGTGTALTADNNVVTSGTAQIASATTTVASGGVTSSATTINVASTSGFSSTGTITIGTEVITYTGVTSTTFTGCTRGVGTAAAAHSSGDSVYQYTGANCVVLPTAVAGRRIVIENQTSSGIAINIYPASGATIDGLVLNGLITLPSGNVMYFNASNGTQWYSSYNLYTSATAAAGVTSVSGGTTGLTPATATTGAITLAGTLAVANGGTGVTTSTGSGNVVLSTSPTLVTPILGTPTSGTLTNATGLPLTTGVTGTLPVANGGTGATTLTSAAILRGNGTSAISAASASDIVTAIGATAVTNATSATTATNLASGSGGTIPYQTGAGTTSMLAAGTSGQILTSGGVGTPSWANKISVMGYLNATGVTSYDFTSIPTTAKRIIINFAQLSTSGTSPVIVQIGSAAYGYLTSTYQSSYQQAGITYSATNGFIVAGVSVPDIRSGSMTLNYFGSISGQQFWAETMNVETNGSSSGSGGGGVFFLGTLVDRVRVTTMNGTDTFDGGAVNVMYE